MSRAFSELSPVDVHQRQIAARRNGYAAWLWPDVDRGNWRKALGEIVSVSSKVLAGERNMTLAAGDATALCVAAYTSGMGPLLGYWIESGTVQAPSEIREMLALHLSHNRRRMARLSAKLQTFVQALNEEGIEPLLLKGMHTAARYFPEPGVRPLSDIDIHVPADETPKAERIFSSLRYQRVLRTRSPHACDWIDPSSARAPRTLTFVHENDPWSFDLLGSLDKRLPTHATVRFDPLQHCSEPAEWLPNARAKVMRQPLLTLYIAAHFSQSLLNATILRALEIVTVIRRDAGTLDWDKFVRCAAAIGGARFVYPALCFTEQLAPGTIPSQAMQAAETDAPKNLRKVIAGLTLASAQPLDRHSVRNRFMWVERGREYLLQIAGELGLDGSGRPFSVAAYSAGTKLWALRRRRYTV